MPPLSIGKPYWGNTRKTRGRERERDKDKDREREKTNICLLYLSGNHTEEIHGTQGEEKGREIERKIERRK